MRRQNQVISDPLSRAWPSGTCRSRVPSLTAIPHPAKSPEWLPNPYKAQCLAGPGLQADSGPCTVGVGTEGCA